MNTSVFVTMLWIGIAQPSFDFFKPTTPERPYAVMVHRGRMDLAPENTRPAIKACIARKYEWVEIDVRSTRDGQHVVFHDGAVDDKTDGRGLVSELSLEEIKKLDAGSTFSKEFSGERILTFRELLLLARNRINVYVDCKDVDPKRLVTEILDTRMERQVVVFDDLDILEQVKEISGSRIPIMPKWRPELGLESWVEHVQPAAVEINADDVTEDFCRRFQELGVVVQAKVLDDDDRPDVWRRMLAAGVQWFQTDRPDELIAECTTASTTRAGESRK
jgi:glycerophosphoryl diester phosphodiesterase